ncbi:hypothetical protein COT48_05545 [Candidatus Woesearchaeota archaeon CG08_land_8_20_14_0_20_47_9]|nr:MAG: hypothetical protein AUJ69_02325 [Candidatus Woesearchaeota archaeon CG1_02_47_18]PIO03274.1 MAG: hypothetical protein COT48_05545 [Candidatus Woesearchaeota archaeon CG08_land_8_20_14_0_20_47_9]HII29634.1 hypothetical protein [Candidatus Woesearchaeota archaeon]
MHRKIRPEGIQLGLRFRREVIIPAAIFILLSIMLAYFFRPWFHGFVMSLYTHPPIIMLMLVVIAAVLSARQRSYVALGIVFLLGVAAFAFIVLDQAIVEYYVVRQTHYHKVFSIPDSDGVRLLPKAVARRYLEDSLQKSRERVGGLNIVDIDSRLSWVAPRIPDGLILYLTQKVNGILVADAETTQRNTSMISRSLAVGEEIGIADNIYWRLFKERYLVDIGDVYYLRDGRSILTVAPIIAYRFSLPVMVPYYDGVYVIDEGGLVTHLSPDEAAADPRFRGNRAFPESLARLYVDSYRYHLGIINAIFLHEDQVEIADVAGQDNTQPFLMSTKAGLKWVVATEPYGESYGVFKIFLVDALTGSIDIMELDENKTLTGPVKVVSYVKKSFPVIDWQSSHVIEPRPYVINGGLYWLLSITPRDFAGVSYSVFVNAENNNVFAFDSDEAAYSFVMSGLTQEAKQNISSEERRREIIEDIERMLAELKRLE